MPRGAEVFFDLRHQSLYETLAGMFEANEHIDLLTVREKLTQKKLLDALGGMAYVAGLQNLTPSAASLTYYLEIILEKYQLRRMIQVCTSAVARVYDHQGPVSELLDQVGSEVLAACESQKQSGSKDIKALMHGAIDRIEEAHQNKGKPTGISTGFPDYDKMTRGLHGGDMIVIAARPSQGKSAIGMNIVEHVAVELGLPCGVFSLEMSAESLALRMLCSRARVNMMNVSDGFLCDRDFPRLTQASNKLGHAPIHIDDSADISIMQLRAKARRMVQQFGVKVFLIDYLQLLSAGVQIENRQREITMISNGVKSIAKELNVPVIALAQLGRFDKDKNRKPRLSDLRESGSIEQDADLVGLLYKPETETENEIEAEVEAVPMNLLIVKQRNGPTGDVHLMFLKGITRFESASKISDMPNYDL
jgi:replicative DNA helicase